MNYDPVVRFLDKRNVLRNHHPYADNIQGMREFDKLYAEAVEHTDMKYTVARRDRFFNLYNALDSVILLQGAVAECGCWKGLSSFILNTKLDTGGEGYHIFDSFEGISQPARGDKHSKGDLACSIEKVRENLAGFPSIEYHRGWIPESLNQEPERLYRFVHIDLDLPDPTAGAFRYFSKRMVPGGIIVCDDYGSTGWVGTKDAVDRFIADAGLRSHALKLSTGQLILTSAHS